jgi:O-antigen ligase
MFSSEVDSAGFSFRARSYGMFLGTVIMVSVAAALVSAKTVPFFFAVMVASFLAAAAVRGQLGDAVPKASPVFWHLGAFLLYATATSAWALEPRAAFGTTVLATLMGLGTMAVLQLIAAERRPNLLHMGEGLWLGLSVALLYLCVELATGQSIKIWVYNLIALKPGDVAPTEYFGWAGGRLVAISREDLSRNMAPVTLFLWPAVTAVMGSVPRSRAIVLAVAMMLIAGVVLMTAWHETSKVAYIGGIAAFVFSRFAPQATARVAMVAWVCACLAVLPAALLAHRLDLHNASWLQSSARHRIIIWNYTAEQVLKAPWLGIGARSTYVLGPRLEPKIATPPDEEFRRTLSTHSHSIYLQTWFELGLVGATLLTLLGLSILQAMASLARRLQPYAYATFASAAIMAASSYGMWQLWFIALFGFCAALFGLGCRLLDESSES